MALCYLPPRFFATGAMSLGRGGLRSWSVLSGKVVLTSLPSRRGVNIPSELHGAVECQTFEHTRLCDRVGPFVARSSPRSWVEVTRARSS